MRLNQLYNEIVKLHHDYDMNLMYKGEKNVGTNQAFTIIARKALECLIQIKSRLNFKNNPINFILKNAIKCFEVFAKNPNHKINPFEDFNKELTSLKDYKQILGLN